MEPSGAEVVIGVKLPSLFGTSGHSSAFTARLASWLDMPIERVMHHGPRHATDPKPVVYYPHESTPEIVEAHLRADKHLTADTAKALSELFRVAYTQFSQTSTRKRS